MKATDCEERGERGEKHRAACRTGCAVACNGVSDDRWLYSPTVPSPPSLRHLSGRRRNGRGGGGGQGKTRMLLKKERDLSMSLAPVILHTHTHIKERMVNEKGGGKAQLCTVFVRVHISTATPNHGATNCFLFPFVFFSSTTHFLLTILPLICVSLYHSMILSHCLRKSSLYR